MFRFSSLAHKKFDCSKNRFAAASVMMTRVYFHCSFSVALFTTNTGRNDVQYKIRAKKQAPKLSERMFHTPPPEETSQTIGFIGLGNMGFHMAANLLRHKFHLNVYDIDQKQMELLQNHQGKLKFPSDLPVTINIMNSPAQVAQFSDVVFTMLPSRKSILQTYIGTPDGLPEIKDFDFDSDNADAICQFLSKGLSSDALLSNPKKYSLFLDCSTVELDVVHQIQKTIQILHPTIDFVDAPVSGGVKGAKDATLSFMIGGTAEAVARAKPILTYLGKNLFHCGPQGMGQVAKLCNNLILGVTNAAVCETFRLASRLGMNASTLTDVLNASTGRSWSTFSNHPVPGVQEHAPSSHGYQHGFSCELMLKDLLIAKAASDSTSSNNPLLIESLKLYKKMCISGHAKKDFSCLYKED